MAPLPTWANLTGLTCAGRTDAAGALQVASVTTPRHERGGRHNGALTVRTDEEMENALTVLAAAEGTSRQEVIRRAVLERYERSAHVTRVQASAGRLADRWADVLERLGSS